MSDARPPDPSAPDDSASPVAGLGHFLASRKRWWLPPIVIALLLLAALAWVDQRSSVAPFDYSTSRSETPAP